MSQELLDRTSSTQEGQAGPDTQFGWGDEAESAEFEYQPVSTWAVVAMLLGFLSLTAFLGLFGIATAFAATVVGIAAVVRIRSERGIVRGIVPASLGMLISVTCFGGGIASQIYHYNTEVPEGFLRVNFPSEISARQFIHKGQTRQLHPEVRKLVDQKIFIKGFMWQTQQDEGLTEFVFLKDNGECCFGGSPQPYDMMHVEMQDGATVDAHNGMIAVAGVLRADVMAGKDEAVYTLEAEMAEPARTRF